MEIKKEKLEQIINQSANPSRLEPEQIPELELYIDQILMLFEDKLGENRRRENDKILTKSMVNNYSKEKMIRPMRGKKYSREQILQILMICNLKNVLSIGDIKQVMTLLMAEGVQAKGMQEIFEKDLKESINVMVDRLKQNYDEEMDTMALVSLLLSFAGIAAYCRKTSEAIIDRFFIEDTKEKNTK